MKKIRSKHIIMFSLIFVLLVSIGIITYAAYTHSLSTQRTIAPYDSSEKFSSNCLRGGDVENNIRTIYVSDVGEDSPNPSTIITVCNYPQGRQILTNSFDITYTLKIEFVEKVNDAYVEVNQASSGYNANIDEDVLSISGSNTSDELESTLTANTISSDVYTLSLSKSFAANHTDLYVLVSAIPDDATLSTLRAIFKADIRLDSVNDQWSGSFMEDGINNPSDYDGYNYIVSGYGSGVFTITWDSSKLSMSYVSLSELLSLEGSTYTEDTENNQNTISFNVDSDVTRRFELQFYKVNIVDETWSDMSLEVLVSSFS